MNPCAIAAIDPGVNGGIAVHMPLGTSAIAMPDEKQGILNFLQGFASQALRGGYPMYCFIEKIGYFMASTKGAPNMAAAHLMGKMGENYGFLQGVVMSLGMLEDHLIFVSPQTWQSHFSLGTKAQAGSRTAWKNKAKDVAQRKFPKLDVTLKTCDSLLLLLYAQETLEVKLL